MGVDEPIRLSMTGLKIVLVILITLFLDTECWAQDEQMIHVVQTLRLVPLGNTLIQKAFLIWKTESLERLMENFKWSDASRTDTVLTRHYNPKTESEERERQVMIYLRRDQSVGEVVLDLAHELVHATSRPNFDPYNPLLSVGNYILGAIDGEGGEVDAVFMECQVAVQLVSRLGIPLSRCQGYLHSLSPSIGQQVDREKIRSDFYRVGDWYSELQVKLAEEKSVLALLSSEAPHLFSSTGHTPYPFALMKEFEEITLLACKNSRNRIGQGKFKSFKKISYLLSFETPVNGESLTERQKEVEYFIHKRCEGKE